MKVVNIFLVILWTILIYFGMYTHAYADTIKDYIDSVPQPIVILTITDCDGNEGWLLGGVLQNWLKAETGHEGYQWLWAQTAETAYMIASSYFYPATTITDELGMSPSECDMVEKEIKEGSV